VAGTLVTEYEFSTDPRSPLVDGLGRFRDDKACSLWDLTGSYRFTKNLRLRGGVLNVLDTAPPFTNQSRYFQVTWDPTYGDPRGRACLHPAQPPSAAGTQGPLRSPSAGGLVLCGQWPVTPFTAVGPL
jgi:hypothetical protein